MANDVPQEDGSIHHWITSSYKVTDTIEGEEIVAREFFDVRIENKKIKEFWLHLDSFCRVKYSKTCFLVPLF